MTALLLAGLLSVATQQQPPRVTTRLDTAVVTLGERLHLTVAVRHAASGRVRWPDSLDLKPFEILGKRASAPVRNGDRVTDSLVLELAAFELGDLKLPSFGVVVEGEGEPVTLATDGWTVTVKSVGGEAAGDIRDVKAPLSIPRNWLLLAPWILAAAALAGLGYWLYRRYRRRATPPVAAPVERLRPADWIAYEALDALERSGLLNQDKVKEYYDGASDIIRRYFEDRYRVTALEMATSEVLQGLERVDMPADTRGDVQRFLETCDLVKFAKMTPLPEACRELVPAARHIVDATKEAPAGPGADSGLAVSSGSSA